MIVYDGSFNGLRATPARWLIDTRLPPCTRNISCSVVLYCALGCCVRITHNTNWLRTTTSTIRTAAPCPNMDGLICMILARLTTNKKHEHDYLILLHHDTVLSYYCCWCCSVAAVTYLPSYLDHLGVSWRITAPVVQLMIPSSKFHESSRVRTPGKTYVHYFWIRNQTNKQTTTVVEFVVFRRGKRQRTNTRKIRRRSKSASCVMW